jgi:hypothetical protein
MPERALELMLCWDRDGQIIEGSIIQNRTANSITFIKETPRLKHVKTIEPGVRRPDENRISNDPVIQTQRQPEAGRQVAIRT